MRTLSWVLCALTLSAAAFGQSNYAAVSGTVRDSQSLPVAHAKVHFKALSTGTTREVTTNDSGLFYAPALPPDDYQLTTSAPGFAEVAQSLRLEVGQKSELDISLKIGAVKEGVSVNAAADILRATDASVGEVIEPKSIQELPLNGRMDRGAVIGFVLFFTDSPEQSLYISGDTVWYEGVTEIARRFPAQVAILHIGAARVPEVGPFHLTMTSEEAVHAAQVFSNAVIVPTHFEGWAHFSEGKDDILRAFRKAGIEQRLCWAESGKAVDVPLNSNVPR